MLTSWVKRLLIANTVVYLASVLVIPNAIRFFALQPDTILTRPWTLLTYMFVHGSFGHLFFNMLALFFFGSPLEDRWGSRNFIKFYLICGLGGAALAFPFAYHGMVLGASGAVYGIMLAFALNWPDQPIYVFGIFPLKAKYLIGIMFAFSLLSTVSPTGDGVAHFAHLGGIIAGWIYLKLDFRGPNAFKKLKRMVNKPKLTVVSTTPPEQKPRARSRREDRALDDVDKVLDKISTQGMASLTPEERKLLDEVSRKYRQN
ncbi:MAG: rhomboid family intramembrane serine protease [Gemmatimonadota bacterium]